MVALIVGMSIAAILMSAAMPVWSQMARREKEAELIFRGQQYARAIGLFQRKAGPGVLPPNLDVLVEQRFLRKKYKDPITGKDFTVVSALRAATNQSSGGAGPGAPSRGTVDNSPNASGNRVAGGVMGVASTSTAESLRTYNGATHYDEWQFVYVQQIQAPGGQAGPAGQRGSGPPGARGGDQGLGRQGNNPFVPSGRGATR